MRQPFFSFLDVLAIGNDTVYNPFDTHAIQCPPFAFLNVMQPIPAAGTLRNLKIVLTVAPGVGQSRSFTIWKATSFSASPTATALTVTVSGTNTEGQNTSDEISLADGEFIFLETLATGSAAATSVYTVSEFDIDDTRSLYVFGGFNASILSGVTTRFDGVLYGGNWTTSTDERCESIVMVPGTLTHYRVALPVAPGAGRSREFVLFKNGVVQDGSGGTVDTRLTVSDTTKVATASFTLPLLALDRLKIRQVPIGSPASTRVSGAVLFVSDNPGEFNLGGAPDVATNVTEFTYPVGRNSLPFWSSSETSREFPGPISQFTVSALTTRVVNVPGVGESVTFMLRANGADTSITTTITSGQFSDGVFGQDVEITTSDTWSFECIPDGTASAQIPYWAFVGSDSTIAGSPSGTSPVEPSPPEEGSAKTYDA